MTHKLLNIDWSPVISHYGVTDNIMCTGFILADGTMLDFGEQRYGFQTQDHCSIEEITGYDKCALVVGTDILKVEHGCGRSLGFYSYTAPTRKQLAQIEDGILFNKDYLQQIDIGLYVNQLFYSFKNNNIETLLRQIKDIYRS